MSVDNPLWGAPRIHGELLKLGFAVAQSSVAKYMSSEMDLPPRDGSRSCATMRRISLPWTCLLFQRLASTCSMYSSSSGWKDLVWINLTARPTTEWIARQITGAFPWDQAPRYLVRDRDRAYGADVIRRLRAMGIRDKQVAADSPWQNSYAERLIGSICREWVDHVVALGEGHQRRLLQGLCALLQWVADASRIEQGRAVLPTNRAPRCHHLMFGSWWLHHRYCRI
jgi:hypothetical protein